MLSKKIKKFRNLFIYFLSFLSSAVGIGLNLFLARVFDANEYGRIQFLVALATTCSQFLIFGINSFLIREAKNKEHNGEIFNKCVSFYLVVALFFIPIINFVLFNKTIYTAGNYWMTAIIIFLSVLMGINSLVAAYFQGKGKYYLTVTFENLIPKLFLIITAFIFYILGKTASFSSLYLLFYIFIYSAISIPILLKHFKHLNFSIKSNEIKSIFFFFGVTVTYSLGNNLTKVLQGGLYHNNVALAIISVSLNVIALVRVFTAVLDNIVKPIFAKKKREKNICGLIDVYRLDTRLNSYITIPLYLFFIIFPTKFLVVFGESYLVYPKILILISIANFVGDITGPNGTMLAMTGNEKFELLNGLLFFVAYVSFVYIFSFDTIYGLSIALLAGQIVVNLAKYIETWIIYKTPPLDKKTIFSLLFIFLVNFAVIFSFKYLNINIYLWYAVGILIGASLILLNCFVLSLYRRHDFKSLLSLRV